MTTTISPTLITNELLALLTETFEKVDGIFLDRGTSLLETLAGISAEEASIPVGSKCATIAAQVTHVCVYLDAVDVYIKTGQNQKVDWGEAWRTVREISPEDWVALQQRLRSAYERAREAIQAFERWDTEHSIGGALGLITHTAYHLGEIRQAMCTVKR